MYPNLLLCVGGASCDVLLCPAPLMANSERNVADEAAVKEHEVCAKKRSSVIAVRRIITARTGDNEFNGRPPIVSNYLSH